MSKHHQKRREAQERGQAKPLTPPTKLAANHSWRLRITVVFLLLIIAGSAFFFLEMPSSRHTTDPSMENDHHSPLASDETTTNSAGTMAKPTIANVPNPINPEMQSMVRQRIQEARQRVIQDVTSGKAWGNLGVVCDAHKLLDCAEYSYRQAHSLSPDVYQFPYLLALVLDRVGQGGIECANLLKTAARLNPEYAPLFFQWGVILHRQGDLVGSQSGYLRAIEIDPALAMAHRNLGQVQLALGDTHAALATLQTAAELDPADGAVYSSLAQLYQRLGEFAQAKKAANLARNHPIKYHIIDPVRDVVVSRAVDSTSAYNRAMQFMQAAQYEQAIANLKICVSADPRDANFQESLGTCYHQTGELELAVQHLSLALPRLSGSSSVHLKLGLVFMQMKQLDQAIEQYRLAIRQNPQNDRAHYHLGIALEKKR